MYRRILMACGGVVANLELEERFSGVQGQRPWSGGGGRGQSPLKLKAFCFWISQGRGHFVTSPRNFANFVNQTYFK